MGLELLIYTAIIDKDSRPNWARAQHHVRQLDENELGEIGLLEDTDADGAREQLLTDLDQFRQAARNVTSRRDLALIRCRGALIYTSGGISAGDPPTEIAASISRLQQAGALAAAGFEG